MNTDTSKQLEKIFMPNRVKGLEKLKKQGNKLSHYTSAENVLNILNGEELWMRTPSCMNDYNEVSFGYGMLKSYFRKHENYINFEQALEVVNERLFESVLSKFDKWWETVQFDTFIASVSEHDKTEDEFGRLSMWRAYGGDSSKAALILNNPEASEDYGVLFYPALYLDIDGVNSLLEQLLESLRSEIDFLKTAGTDKVENYFLFSLISLVLSLKHKGFHEEKEWRIIYLRQLTHHPHIKKEVVSLGGVPQVVYKLPLNQPRNAEGKFLNLNELLDYILIGPTSFPAPIFDAFCETILDKKLDAKVKISNIPLRT